jgi:hypothetical protein
MKASRIEQLLRTKPRDEPVFETQLLHEGPDAEVVRPRVAPAGTAPMLGLASAAVVIVAVVLAGVTLIVRQPAAASPKPMATQPVTAPVVGVIPWLDATPAPSPTPEPTADPATLPRCSADELVLRAGGWGGATGSMAGGATLVNLGANPCRIDSQLPAELSDANGTVIATRGAAPIGEGSVAVPPGDDVGAIVVWMNWCGAEPQLPLALTLTIAGPGGQAMLSAVVENEVGGAGVPRCDAPQAGSTVGTLPFAPLEPSTSDYEPKPCEAKALSAYSGLWGAGLGSSYDELVVLNRGSLDCLLPTSPTIDLRDAGGKVLIATPPLADRPATVLLPPGWTAVARIAFADWCVTAPALPMRMDLLLDSGTITFAQPSSEFSRIPVPGCMSAPDTSSPEYVLDSPFTIPRAPMSEPDPIDSLPVLVTISALPQVAPGSILEYTVTLTNVTPYDKPLNLAAFCSSYTESISLPKRTATHEETYELNCADAGTLEPNSSLSFAMRVTIPADAPLGTAGLRWQLGQRGPAGKTTFEIGS